MFVAQAVGAFFALQASHPRLIETILRRRDVPRRLLVDLARRYYEQDDASVLPRSIATRGFS